MDNNVDQEKSWIESLPEDVRQWQEVQTADTPEKFWDQIKNMRSRLGRSLTVPSEDAGEEERKAFYEKLRKHAPDLMPMPKDPESFDMVLKALGKPDDPDGYELPKLEVPEGIQFNEDRLKYFKQLALEAGLTKRQFEIMAEKFLGNELQQYMQLQEQEQKKLADLKNSWGATFEQRLQQAEAIRQQHFPFLQGPLTADMIQAFVSIAESMGEEPNTLEKDTDRSGVLTPDEAALQLDAIFKNKQHPYWHPEDPAHKAARQRVRELTAMKLGETLKGS